MQAGLVALADDFGVPALVCALPPDPAAPRKVDPAAPMRLPAPPAAPPGPRAAMERSEPPDGRLEMAWCCCAACCWLLTRVSSCSSCCRRILLDSSCCTYA